MGFVFDGTQAQVYIDGSTYDLPVKPLVYGGIDTVKLMTRGDALTKYAGKMDEVRLSTTARSTEWIQTAYNNQNSPSTFMSFGSEETN